MYFVFALCMQPVRREMRDILKDIEDWRLAAFDEFPEVTSADIMAYLTRKSQSTLFQLLRHSRKPLESEMISAAARFFFTFYTRESIREYPPRLVLVACINLAVKTEEYHAVSLSDLVNALPDAADLKAQVPIIEMKLLAALEYDLVVEQPWLVMLYWVEILRAEGDDTHLKVYDVACEIMRIWQWTDAVLVFQFPELATAAVVKACMQVSATRSTPEEDPDGFMARLDLDRTIPGVDVNGILESIEKVVHRHGQFERLLKDPMIERSPGFVRLSEVLGFGE